MKVSILGLLGVLFVGLKLGGIIDWSWFWVLSPFWIGGILTMVVVAVLVRSRERLSALAKWAEKEAGQ